MGFEDKRIAIIGGGLGGMAFLNAASYAGLKNVQLYEQAHQFGEVGAGVSITSNANRVLDAFGLKESLLRKSSPQLECYMEYRNYKTGDYLGHINEFSSPHNRLLHRAHLLDALKERVPKDRLHLNKRLLSIDRNGSSEVEKAGAPPYTIHFEDGTTAEADIIIGCDGIKSKVRQEMGLVDKPIYSGQVVYRGFVDYKDLKEETAQLLRPKLVNFRGPKRHVLILPIGNQSTGTDRAGIIGFMSEPLESWKSESWMSRSDIESLQEHVRDWCPQVQDIISGLRKGSPDGRMLKQALYVRDPLNKWFEMSPIKDAGIVLLGDSVHSTLPHQGQGTCMAIESGIALATILRHWKTDNLKDALQFYQDVRKPRTDRVTKTSYEAGKLASSDNPSEMSANFNPEALSERMKWIMEYSILDDLKIQGADYMNFQDSRI
ncbi:hypothetical protein N7468_005416 [Penicillium chermesinum]|uniref:FAD-binding domain-containing protein n=1 Tax=Penicillium chermesinum TaxID=63820 RepID=A0A9W9NZD1_9EURO|nr:uncharacterized protein N7468_005416 [Penicillium chermesinum]KAJ5232460.1 hypothetical protein N7468_005416 [Penicillium chermesinum]KAJ6172118.1 hypothetical protein N7470_001185 [Penicillium chermesinum]